MVPPLFGLLYVAVLVWVATGLGLMWAFRRAAPPVVLRLAATFLALWALLATTTLIWVLANGGLGAVDRLLHAPATIFEARYWALWVEGTVGAFLVFLVAFLLNQLVGQGFLRLLRPEPISWPARLPRPTVPVTLLRFRSESAQAFSFTLLSFREADGIRPHRREVILLSDALADLLAPDELEAAVAHELGHIRGLDGRYLTFLRTLSRMMRWDPMLAWLAYTLTRREEYRADFEGACLTGNPLALARALYKVNTARGARAPTSAAGFIGGSGPRGRRETLERIRRLVELAESGRFDPRGETPA